MLNKIICLCVFLFRMEWNFYNIFTFFIIRISFVIVNLELRENRQGGLRDQKCHHMQTRQHQDREKICYYGGTKGMREWQTFFYFIPDETIIFQTLLFIVFFLLVFALLETGIYFLCFHTYNFSLFWYFDKT